MYARTRKPTHSLRRHNPEILEQVDVAEPHRGLRMLGSLLKQLGKRELAPLRRQEMEWVYGLTGKAGSAMYMVSVRDELDIWPVMMTSECCY